MKAKAVGDFSLTAFFVFKNRYDPYWEPLGAEGRKQDAAGISGHFERNTQFIRGAVFL